MLSDDHVTLGWGLSCSAFECPAPWDGHGHALWSEWSSNKGVCVDGFIFGSEGKAEPGAEAQTQAQLLRFKSWCCHLS